MEERRETVGPTTVKRALFAELESRGYAMGGDTVGLRGDLYVRGAGDSAAALFEVKATADEACATMYQGRWLDHLPPRFAVLPVSERHEQGIEFLVQSGLSVLYYEVCAGDVVFPDIVEAVASFRSRR
jgi:hypothetical protein